MYGRDLWIETHPNHDDWICHFCREQIDPAAQPRSPGSLNVHHLDGDHDNDAPENLSPAHQRCHARYHMEVRLANGYREEIGRVHRGKVVSTCYQSSTERRARSPRSCYQALQHPPPLRMWSNDQRRCDVPSPDQDWSYL